MHQFLIGNQQSAFGNYLSTLSLPPPAGPGRANPVRPQSPPSKTSREARWIVNTIIGAFSTGSKKIAPEGANLSQPFPAGRKASCGIAGFRARGWRRLRACGSLRRSQSGGIGAADIEWHVCASQRRSRKIRQRADY